MLFGCGKGTIGGTIAPSSGDGSVANNNRDGGPQNNPNDGGVTQEGPFVASAVVARRLTQAELDNVLFDLFGDDTAPATRFLSEDEFSPYDNDYRLQDPSQAMVESLAVLAEDVAGRLLADPVRRARIVTCAPTGAGDSACFRQIIAELGRKMLRRPLSAAEIDAYATLQTYSTENNMYVATSFDTGVGLLLQALIQDPEFVHRVEIGAPVPGNAGVFELNAFEIASRMSFLIWGTAPDDNLLDAAESGRLNDPTERRTIALQMLDDPRAKNQVHRFHAMWLGYRAIPGTPQLIAGFQRETTALLDKVIFEDKSDYREIFRSNQTYLDATLADHYGLPRPAAAVGWVTYPAASKRAGLLSHGTVLAAFSKFTDTSPTQRGILIRTRLMCTPIGRPPPNVNADMPPGENTAACKKDRYVAHVQSAGCAGCHNQMDPIGFGLENFDIAGRWRDHDEGKPECPIDGAGALPGGQPFSGPAELAQLLLDQQLIDACMVQQYLAFALGRTLEPEEIKLTVEVLNRFRASGHGFDRMIADYVASAPFARRKEGT